MVPPCFPLSGAQSMHSAFDLGRGGIDRNRMGPIQEMVPTLPKLSRVKKLTILRVCLNGLELSFLIRET